MHTICQRADQINSASGYLLSLTDKAREGKLSTWPMVMALLRAKLDEIKRLHTPGEANFATKLQFDVSDSLPRSLE